MATKRVITNDVGWVTIIKPGDTARTSTTTPAADPELQFTMEASCSYYIDLFVNIYVRTNPDFKYSLILPTGFFRAMQSIVAQQAAIAQTIILSAPANATVLATTENYGFIRITGPYTTTSGGTFSFDWSQNTSDAVNAATVVAGSFLNYFRF